MKVNFFGTLNCIKSVEEYYRTRGSGHISIVSSIAGYRVLPNSTGYGPSKSALNNLAESLYFDFKMPFLKTVDYAAEKIFEGLTKTNQFEIHFPKQLTLILKFLKILPNSWYLSLVGRLTKYQKR